MQTLHFPPADSLNDYIASYGIIDLPDGFTEPYISPPLGLSGFILALEGTPNAWLNGNSFASDLYAVTGQVTAPVTGEHPAG